MIKKLLADNILATNLEINVLPNDKDTASAMYAARKNYLNGQFKAASEALKQEFAAHSDDYNAEYFAAVADIYTPDSDPAALVQAFTHLNEVHYIQDHDYYTNDFAFYHAIALLRNGEPEKARLLFVKLSAISTDEGNPIRDAQLKAAAAEYLDMME